MTNPPRLTRRELLSVGGFGVGAFGLAGGIGAIQRPAKVEHNQVTVAQSTDEGDLIVEWKEWYNGSVVEPSEGRSTDNQPILSISDIKPGDDGSVSFNIYVDDQSTADNAVKLLMRMRPAGSEFSDNGLTEPELVAGDTGEPGELQEFVPVNLWYDMDGMIDSADACNGVKDVGERFVDADPMGVGDLVDGDPLGAVTGSDMLGEWTQLDGDPETTDSVDCLPVGVDEAICLGLDWELPGDLSGTDDNIVQTDSAEFTIEFRIESCETTG